MRVVHICRSDDTARAGRGEEKEKGGRVGHRGQGRREGTKKGKKKNPTGNSTHHHSVLRVCQKRYQLGNGP